jgi:predicted Fe-S protein YdhL (DUF1289 family)
MAVRVLVHQVCDRCGNPFDEKQVDYGTDLPKIERATISAQRINASGAVVLFQFEDLCPGCGKEVEELMSKIRMDDSKKSDVTKDKKAKAPPAASAAKEAAPF